MSNPDGYMLNGKIYSAPFAFTENAVMKYITELEAENKRLRRSVDNIKIRSYELGQRELHDMAWSALKENNDER